MLGIAFDRRLAAFAGLLACLSLSPAQAQSAAPSAQELNPIARAPAPAPQAARGDLLAPPEPGPCPLRASKLTFKLTGVAFKGTASVSTADLAPAYAGLVGQTIPVSALCDIRDRASDILFDHNLFARVEIPEQRIADGQVTFQVIEAFIAKVRVLGDDSPAQSKVEDYIEKLRGMRPFDLVKAQRYLFLAQDVPGVSVAATLKRGGPEPGAIELDITIVSHKLVDGVVSVQNYGSRSIGPYGAVFRVDLNSLTSLGERTSLVGYQTFDVKEQRVLQAVEEIRLGSEGLLARGSFAVGETHPGGALSPLGLSALSYVGDMGLNFPVVRSRGLNVNLGGGLQLVDQHVGLSSGPLLSQDRLRVLYARLEGNRIYRGDIPLFLSSSIEMRQGVNFFGASHGHDAGLSRVDGDPDGFVLRGETQAVLGQLSPGAVGNFFSGFSENLRLQAQYSKVPLLSYEQMAIGDLTIGRGYDPASVNGDSGVAGSAEIHWTPWWDLFPPDWHLKVSPYGFYDVAQVWNRGTSLEDRRLRSAGAGLTIQFTDHYQLDGLYAHPMDTVSSTSPQRPGDRFLINLTVGY